MDFDNPQRFDCPGCGRPLELALEDVVGLRASCPSCGRSLRERGLSLRQRANRMTSFFVAWEAVWIFEARYGFRAADDEVREIETPRQLVNYVQSRSGDRATEAEVLRELAGRIRRPLDPSHLDTLLAELVPSPVRE